jgi:hypothetical protein
VENGPTRIIGCGRHGTGKPRLGLIAKHVARRQAARAGAEARYPTESPRQHRLQHQRGAYSG